MTKNEKLGKSKYAKTHGLGNTRLHRIWHSMYCRCYYPTTNGYKNYGGRGIKVCDEWKTVDGFLRFYSWSLDNGYRDDYTLDRINTDGNYEPNNCRWVSNEVQSNNRRTNNFITYNGKTQTQIQWCREYNINVVTFSDRLKRGWNIEQALTIPTKGMQRKV